MDGRARRTINVSWCSFFQEQEFKKKKKLKHEKAIISIYIYLDGLILEPCVQKGTHVVLTAENTASEQNGDIYPVMGHTTGLSKTVMTGKFLNVFPRLFVGEFWKRVFIWIPHKSL